jgi:hypothetical protein
MWMIGAMKRAPHRIHAAIGLTRVFHRGLLLTATSASDGERVYVFFRKSGAAALDLAGAKLWQTSLGTDSNRALYCIETPSSPCTKKTN